MPRTLNIQMNSFPIAGAFTISRGAKTEAEVITCTLAEDGGHVRLYVEPDHRGAALEQRLHAGLADTRGCAGDKRNFSRVHGR